MSIEVESELGKGTAFIFRIPFKIDQNIHQQDEMEPQEHPQERMLRGMKILLAEDNEINMEIAEFYLTELGAEVDKAWNGKECIRPCPHPDISGHFLRKPGLLSQESERFRHPHVSVYGYVLLLLFHP